VRRPRESDGTTFAPQRAQSQEKSLSSRDILLRRDRRLFTTDIRWKRFRFDAADPRP
jgi:hypothetical protein